MGFLRGGEGKKVEDLESGRVWRDLKGEKEWESGGI